MRDWLTAWWNFTAGFAIGMADPAASQPARPVPAAAWLYAVLFLACLNPVLRPAVDVPVTPYYLLSPLLGLWLLVSNRRTRLLAAGVVLVCGYGVAVGIAAGTPLIVQSAQIIKYLQLLVLFGVLAWLRRHDPAFALRCASLLIGVAWAAFLVAAVQAQTGFEFPTVVNEESNLWLNTFFFTPNDIGLFLAAVLIVVLTSSRGLALKILFTAIVVALNVRNDAKAVLLAIALIVCILLCMAAARRLRVPPLLVITAALVLLVLMVAIYAESEFGFNEQEVSALNLLIDPLRRVVDLDPYDLGGSVFDRTDALIYAITELKANHWLGLGPGGSVHVLTLQNYELLTAKSLHNALAELAVDLGPVAVVPGVIVLIRVLWRLRHVNVGALDAARTALVVALPFLAVSQSSGYISNYAFWIATYLLWVVDPASTPRHRPKTRLDLAMNLDSPRS